MLYLIGLSLILGLCGLGLFLWSLSRGQFDDLEGASRRVLFDDMDDEEPPRPSSVTPPVPRS